MRYHRKNIFKVVLYATILSQPLIFSSCAEDSLSWLVDTPIKVTAAVDQPTTRSGANIQTSNFEADETINGYFNISGGEAIGKTPTVLTTSAPDESGKNRLSPDVQPYYPSDGTIDIMALYPPTKATNTTTSFAVEPDQTDVANYMLSDLMWAGITNQAKTTSDIKLTFSHLMSKMTVNVTAKEGVLVKKVSLINTIRTVPVALSASGCDVGNVGTESDDTKKTIVLASTTSTDLDNQLSGSVLLPPQTIGGNFIEVETNYGTAYYSAFNKEFKRGEAYSTDIVVKRQDIGYTTTITNWVNNDGSIAVPPGSSAGLKITAIPDQQYNGSAKTPELTITYRPNDDIGYGLGGNTYDLIAGEDYTAEYFNNVNQGTAMVIITGKVSSLRTTEAQRVLANIISQIKSMTSFKITAATGVIEYPSTSLEVEYDYNTTVEFELNKHGGDGKFTYESSDESIADVTVSGIVTIRSASPLVTDPETNVQSLKPTRITASMDNSGNYSAATTYYDLTVKPRSLKNHSTGDNPEVTATLAAISFPYQDVEYSPAVVVKDNGRTLQEGKHYTYSVVNNRNIGTATITIRGKGNYSDADADVVTRTFEITAVTPDITFDNTAVIVPKGQKYTRRAKTDYGTITYSASPAGFVTISSDGVVTATNTAANSQSQTVTITASVAADPGGNWIADSKTYQLTVVESEWSYVYSSSAKIQEWECPVDGVYQLEAMGAQGASTTGFNGGRGADIAGQVYIQKGQKLYIYLGEGGSVHGTTATFNGGGYYMGSTADAVSAQFTGGGGATDFSLIKNTDWADADHLYSRILVAGGGGGALYCNTKVNNATKIYCGGGGCGGGEATEGRADYVGETGYGGSHPGSGGTLIAGGTVASGSTSGEGGSFGAGGNYRGELSAGCGGGGWYGGASGATENPQTINNRQGAGGGGSSFIYNSQNIDKTTNTSAPSYNYRTKLRTPASGNYFDPATLEITPSIRVTGGSPDANGQARIKYMSAE